MLIFEERREEAIEWGMKIIHTGDWHLGQSLHGLDRYWEQELFLEWLLDQVRDEQPDLLLVAGDVFDSPNPPARASTLYYRFLAQLAMLDARPQVVVIAGNHDSASRLEAPRELLEQLDIQVRGVVRKTDEGEVDYDYLAIPIKGGGTCLAVPYLRQGDYLKEQGYGEGIRQFYYDLVARIPREGAPIVAMGHLHVVGGQMLPDDTSERAIIGGLEYVPVEAFSERIAYTALGHLHRAQRVGGTERIRYAGAPLPTSFSEENYRQGVLKVELKGEEIKVTTLPYSSPIVLRTIGPAGKGQVLAEIGVLPDLGAGEVLPIDAPLLRVLVELSEPEPTLRVELEEALRGKCARMVLAQPIYPSRAKVEEERSLERLEQSSELEVAQEVYKQRFGTEMPEVMCGLLASLIDELQEWDDL